VSENVAVTSGVVIDGGVYPLAGQPPPAQSHGWGDLSWLYSPYGYRRGGGIAVVSVPGGSNRD